LARRLGATAEQLAAIGRSEYSELEPAWRAALAYAEAMTPTRGHVGDDMFAELASHWTAAQIVEITAVVALFNYFNRFAEALAIPVTR
jgi:alkylhydroperoxidase family enzyme